MTPTLPALLTPEQFQDLTGIKPQTQAVWFAALGTKMCGY